MPPVLMHRAVWSRGPIPVGELPRRRASSHQPPRKSDPGRLCARRAEGSARRHVASFDYRYVPRAAPLGRLTGPMNDKMLTGTFTDMLAATEAAAVGSNHER